MLFQRKSKFALGKTQIVRGIAVSITCSSDG